MAAKIHLSPVQQEELKKFWPTLKPLRVLASDWGCSEAYISMQAKSMGLPSRRDRMNEIRVASRYIPKTTSAYLVHEAAKRGLTDETLLVALVNVIIKDRLVGAILDDEKKAA